MSRFTALPRLINSSIQLGLLRNVRTLPRNLPQKQFTLNLSTAALETQSVAEKESDNSIDNDTLDVSTLGLSPLLQRSLNSRKIETLFSIQKDCFQHIVEGKDLVGRARTGTGKTLAFSLPVIQRLEQNPTSDPHFPRVLILAPTRELANQVDKEISQLSGSVYKTICIYGGSAYGPQENALRRGVDIVVGTPGRVQDMINKGHLNLSKIETLILDEADHMLDIGFAQDLDVIIQSLKTQRSSGSPSSIIGANQSVQDRLQILLFSATVPEWIKKAINKYLKKDHIYIDHVGSDVLKTNPSILQLAVPTLRDQMTATVSGLLQTQRTAQGRCIIFCETKTTCDSLASELGNIKGVAARALHGDVSQASREKALSDFRSGVITCLVATDVAARGLDIANVELVIQTEPPRNTETFIHRSGRTGRAGNKGTCVILFDPRSRGELSNISKQAGVDFKIVPAPSSDSLQQNMIVDFVKQLNSVSSFKTKQLASLLDTNFDLIRSEIREDSRSALLAAYAAFAKLPSNVCKPRSLIDAREGYTTLCATGISRESDISDFCFNKLKMNSFTIRQSAAVKNNCAIVFDVPSDIASELITASSNAGLSASFEIVKELPEINQSYGVSSRSSGSSRFGSNNRGGYGFNRGSSGGQSSGGSRSKNSSGSDRYGAKSSSGGNFFRGGSNYGGSRDNNSRPSRSGSNFGGSRDNNSRSSSRGSSNFGGSRDNIYKSKW